MRMHSSSDVLALVHEPFIQACAYQGFAEGLRVLVGRQFAVRRCEPPEASGSLATWSIVVLVDRPGLSLGHQFYGRKGGALCERAPGKV